MQQETTKRKASGLAEIEIVKKLISESQELKLKVNKLYRKTNYEDLEHAELGLEIVEHALDEVAEHKGKGGQIEQIFDPAALKKAKWLKERVDKIQDEAKQLLKTHATDEDLETAIKSLEICEGSIDEVIESYGG